MPSPTPAQILASALLSATSREPGVSSQVRRPQTAGISDGLKPLASSFLLALTAQRVSQVNTSGSLETTKESSKDGRKEGAEIGRLVTKSSDASTTSQILTNAFLSCATLPANKTQQRRPQEDSTLQLLISAQQSAYQLLSGNISSSRFPPPPPPQCPIA